MPFSRILTRQATYSPGAATAKAGSVSFTFDTIGHKVTFVDIVTGPRPITLRLFDSGGGLLREIVQTGNQTQQYGVTANAVPTVTTNSVRVDGSGKTVISPRWVAYY